MTVVIGLDLGHSAVKMTFDGVQGIQRAGFPSLACPGRVIEGNDLEAKRAQQETVIVNGERYFVGETARVHGGAILPSGLSEDWILSDHHTALMLRARKLVEEYAPSGPRLWVLGLPVNQYAAHRQLLLELAQRHLGNGSGEILVVPQPLGGFNAFTLHRNGTPMRPIERESWAVVDVGYFSTDFALLYEGRWIQNAAGGCGGVRLAAERLLQILEDDHRMKVDLIDAEYAISNGQIKYYGRILPLTEEVKRAKKFLAERVVDSAVRLMDAYVRRLDGVLLTGGGAEMLLPFLQETWPHVRLIDDTHPQGEHRGSRYIISEGYYRYGRLRASLREQEQGRVRPTAVLAQ